MSTQQKKIKVSAIYTGTYDEEFFDAPKKGDKREFVVNDYLELYKNDKEKYPFAVYSDIISLLSDWSEIRKL